MSFKLKYRPEELIVIVTIIIFATSAIDKVINFSNFYVKFAKIPLINLTELWYLAYVLIISELAIVITLFLDKTRLFGLYLAFFSLIVFTTQLILLYTSKTDGCSYGGIFNLLSMESHLILNALLMIGLKDLILIIKDEKQNKGFSTR